MQSGKEFAAVASRESVCARLVSRYLHTGEGLLPVQSAFKWKTPALRLGRRMSGSLTSVHLTRAVHRGK